VHAFIHHSKQQLGQHKHVLTYRYSHKNKLHITYNTENMKPESRTSFFRRFNSQLNRSSVRMNTVNMEVNED